MDGHANATLQENVSEQLQTFSPLPSETSRRIVKSRISKLDKNVEKFENAVHQQIEVQNRLAASTERLAAAIENLTAAILNCSS